MNTQPTPSSTDNITDAHRRHQVDAVRSTRTASERLSSCTTSLPLSRSLRSRLGAPSSIVIAMLTAMTGCGGSSLPGPHAAHHANVTHKASGPVHNVTPHNPRIIAEPLSGTVGPYLAFRPNASLAVYAGFVNGKRSWFSRPLDATGRPTTPKPYKLAPAAKEPSFAVARASQRGFVVLWSEPSKTDTALYVLGISSKGRPLGPPKLVVRTDHQIVWADYRTTPQHGLVLWSTQQDDSATIHVRQVGDGHQISEAAFQVAQGAKAWDVAAADDGLVLAVVVARRRRSQRGQVQLIWLDRTGKRHGPTTHVSAQATAKAQVRVVRSGDSWNVAWTDHQHGNDTVLVGSIRKGETRKTHFFAPVAWTSNQRLVDMKGSAAGGSFLAIGRDMGAGSCGVTRIVRLDKNLTPSRFQADVTVKEDEEPMLTAHDGELLMLTPTSSCEESSGPVVARFDASMRMKSAGELVEHTAGEVMTWGAGCTARACFSLVASGKDPVHIQTTSLTPHGPRAKTGSFVTLDMNEPLQVTTTGAVYTHNEPLASLDAVHLADRVAIGWLSRFKGKPGPHRKPPKGAPGNPTKPMEAQLGVVFVSAGGRRLGKRAWVSVRARTVGGFAMAANRSNPKDLCVAWTARDGRHDQIFLTRIGSTGKRKLQRMLTRGPHNARAISLTPAKAGWFVGWAEQSTRRSQGHTQLRVARVSESLIKVGPVASGLTSDKQDVLGTSVLFAGDKLWVAYAVTQRAGAAGEVLIREIEPNKMRAVGAPISLGVAAGRRISIRTAATSSGIVVAWSTTTNMSSQTAARGIVFDPATRTVVRSEDVPGQASRGGLALSCDGDTCRGLIDMKVHGGDTAIRAFVWRIGDGGGQGRDLLMTGEGRTAAPVLVGDKVYYLGRSGDGRPQVRRAQVRWP